MEFKEILNRKIKHYGKTEAAYEFAAEEYANKLIKEAQTKQLPIPIVSGSFIVNGFEITQQKNLHPTMLSWQAKHLIKDITFAGKTKKECISWCENYR